MVESNAAAAQEIERTANPPSDAAPQRLDGNDTQSKADNRPDTKTGNSTSGKGKSQASHAAHSNDEATADTEDASQPLAIDETTISAEIAIVLSADALAANAEQVATNDAAVQVADVTDAATAAIPAIVANTASVVAVALPVAPAANIETAPSASDSAATIPTIETAAATSAAVASAASSASTSEISVAATASSGAASSVLPVPTQDSATATVTTSATLSADRIAQANAAKTLSQQQTVASETVSPELGITENVAVSAQAAAVTPAPDKPKSTAAAPPVPTPTLTSADAEAASALNSAPSLPGQTVDAAAPRGADSIGGSGDKPHVAANEQDAPSIETKQANSPLVAAVPAEQRAPVPPTHSASLDLALQTPQTPLPQSFQAQSPNIVVTPAAQLNATLANTPVPINGLAVDIALRAAGGASRFEIRLDPAELGRIDVRLDVDKNGNVTSHLTVEKPSTLDMLRRDAPQLQRALEDAGLKTGDSGLQFSLRDQSSSGRNDDNHSGRNSQRLVISEDDTVPAQVAGKTYGRMLGSSGGVDIRV